MDGKFAEVNSNLANKEEPSLDEESDESKTLWESQLAKEKQLTGVPSPLQSAVPLATGKDKQRYKNDDYLNEILMVINDNPPDDDMACFFVSTSYMIFRMVSSESVKFLRKKYAFLMNYQRLLTASEPELTMERVQSTLTRRKKFKEETFKEWESKALHAGAPRIFLYFLSYMVNHPLYVLDLSTNEWREYDLSSTNYEQSQFYSDLVEEYKFFNFIGPPFIVAEHLEDKGGGKLARMHVSPVMHKSFYDGDDVLGFNDYISMLVSPVAKQYHSFVVAEVKSDTVTEPGGDENVNT